MNNQARLRLSPVHGLEDLIKRNNDIFEIAEIELQRQIRARHFPRNSNHGISQPVAKITILIGHWAFGVGRFLLSDNDWPVAVAHARAAWKQRILVGDISISVDRNS